MTNTEEKDLRARRDSTVSSLVKGNSTDVQALLRASRDLQDMERKNKSQGMNSELELLFKPIVRLWEDIRDLPVIGANNSDILPASSFAEYGGKQTIVPLSLVLLGEGGFRLTAYPDPAGRPAIWHDAGQGPARVEVEQAIILILNFFAPLWRPGTYFSLSGRAIEFTGDD